MKAVRGAAGGVEVVEIDEPLGDGELVKVSAVSICASDLRYLRRGSTQFIGHEISGFTQAGEPVVVEGLFGCGACEWCRQGRQNRCERAGSEILGMTVAGGMAEYFKAPREALIPLPGGLRPEDASIAEPGAVAWHACRRAEIEPGMRVVVVGAGAIGLLALLAAQRLGAAEVALAGRHDFQIQAGERFGADRPSGEYDVVIEASGSQSGLERSIELTRPGGCVSTVSVFEPDLTWPYRSMFLKEVSVVPSMGYCSDGERREIAEVAQMLAERPEIVQTLITHRFGIDESPEAFATAARRPEGTFKVVVHP